MATLLQTQGWELDTAHVDVDGYGYKIVRDGLEIDVIASEGRGARAAAGDHVGGPQRHLEDLAGLCRLVADPAA